MITNYRLRDCMMVDPVTRTIVHGSLTVSGDRIGDDDEPIQRTIPLDGAFVLPGLIDMHVHIVPSTTEGRDRLNDILQSCRESLRSALRSGVTTVRDLGGTLDVLLPIRREQRVGGFEGSRLFIAGPVLTVPGGHGMASGHGVPVSTVRDAEAVIAALAEVPVDLIKLVTSGARGTHQMPPEMLRAAIAAARRHGMPVAVHAHLQPEQLHIATQSGANSIEHGFLLHRLPGALETMAAEGLYLCPTLRVIEAIRAEPNWHGQRLVPRAWDDALTTVRAAYAAGVELIAGTDSGVFGVQPIDVWREVQLIAEQCGSRWPGLRAATSVAAAALGRPDLGHLSAGSVADLVVLRADPVVQVVGPEDVIAVVQAGRPVVGIL